MRHQHDQTPEHLARIEAHAARIQAQLSQEEPERSPSESEKRHKQRLAKVWTYHLKRRAEGIQVA